MFKQIRNCLGLPFLSNSNLARHLQIKQSGQKYYLQINTNCYRKFSCLILGVQTKSKNLRETTQINRLVLQQTSLMSTVTTKDEQLLRDKYKPKECQFETPYGVTAALEWGRPDAPHKILCSHGWLDNASSFERLVPFILDHENNAENYHIIAMDHPGVGLSSHKPQGAEYTMFSTIIEMKRIMDQLKWTKATLLAHSLGAHHSFMYSCIYPSQIDTLISIDLTQPLIASLNMMNANLVNAIDEHFKYEYSHTDDPITNIRIPVYSKDDALQRLMESHANSLTKESAEFLLKRGAKKQSWGYTFSRDVRVRNTIGLGYTEDIMRQYLIETFRPNLMIIRGNQSPYNRNNEVRARFYEIFNENCPIFEEVCLEGTHHLHMNNPEPVAAEVNRFLENVRKANENGSKLSTRSNL